MAILTPTQERKLSADYKTGKYSGADLAKKYNLKSTQALYENITVLRKKGLLPESKLSKAIKAYYERKRSSGTTVKSSTANTTEKYTPKVEYRTVYFKDFSVQIHKKAMARLVVDQNNNLHILNS